MVRKPLDPQRRAFLNARWSAFVEAILGHTQWTEAQLAHRIGVSEPCVSRWRSTAPETARLPSGPCQKQLIQLATELGLA